MSTPEERQWQQLFRSLDRIEDNIKEKVDKDQLKEYKDDMDERMERMESDLDALKQAALTPDQVTTMIGDGLRQSEARGLTARDRYIRYGLAILSLGSFILIVFNAWHGNG